MFLSLFSYKELLFPKKINIFTYYFIQIKNRIGLEL